MSNLLKKQQILATTAFGEASVANPSPVVQITGQYGLLDDVLTATLGGTTETIDSKFSVSTGTGASNVAAIVSRREAQCKAGQGLLCRITAVFSQGVANSTQQAGFITSESSFCFGYNGADFGIVHSRDGQLEYQELLVTSSAVGNQAATITVDGVDYIVNLTTGTEVHNAFEIATSLNTQVGGYSFTSNSNTVYALAQLPDFGGGSFAFTSANAVASWTQIQNGTIPSETWVNKADWNVRSDIDIDPALGNVYQIQMQYLGFGGIRFFVEDPETAEFVLVHVIQYANSATVPSVSNPIFRVGWAVRNTGNTTDIILQGASAAAFIEGKIEYDGKPRGFCQTQPSVGVTRVNVLGFRNRLTFNGTANRAEIIPLILSLATDTTKIAVFEIIQDPVPSGGDLIWSYVDQNLSLMEVTTDNTPIVGGTPVACINVTSGSAAVLDMQKILESQSPNAEFSITARVTSGLLSEMSASGTWKEDL